MCMHVLVDTREQAPWTFEAQRIRTTRAKLDTGDYTLADYPDRICIERKSADDYVNTLLRSRKRFYAELHRMRAFDVRAVIVEIGIEGLLLGEYTSTVLGESILQWTAEICVSQRVPVYLAGGRVEGAHLAGALMKQAQNKFAKGIDTSN